jgi:beta-1,4-galactosyltransferase 1
MKPIIIVPYRNREEHLSRFILEWPKIYKDLKICVVEQVEGKPFNRGKLLNIGYLENPGYSHYVFHDVDMLPIIGGYTVNYKWQVVQLAKSNIQAFDYLGGVTRFSKTAFERVGGYNNEYYHRAEDNEMMFNLKRLGISVTNKPYVYKVLDHERKGPEFDPALWQKAQLKRKEQNQLKLCRYTVIQTKEIGEVRHIVVRI